MKTIELTSKTESAVPGSSTLASDSIERFRLPAHSAMIWASVALTSTAILCLRNLWVFSFPLREDTDYAANSILVNQADRFQLLVGNYSREGFNHPGPAFLYIQSFGQDLFYSVLHVVPYQYNGQLVGVFVLNSVIIALVALVLARHIGSWPIALLALLAMLLLTGSTADWSSAWMPYLYVAPFMLATVAGVSVAVGALKDLPIFTFAVCLLIHGHVAFIGIMGIYVLVVTVGWFVLRRRNGRYRAQLVLEARSLILSGCVLALFALPIILNLVLHWPGEFKLYWDYAHSSSHKYPHSLGQVAIYVEQFWPGGSAGRIALLGAGIAGVILGATERNRNRRLFFLGLLAAVLVVTLEVALYALRGVDVLSLTYTGYFYYAIPPLIVAVLVLEVGDRVRRALSQRNLSWKRGVALLGTAAVVVSGGLYLLASQPSFYNSYRGDPALPAMASSVARDPARQGRQVAISLGVPGAPSADWPDVVGLLIAASREGYQPCVANPAWKFMMTSQYICTAEQAERRWRITVNGEGIPISPGSSVVFRDPSTVVTTGSLWSPRRVEATS